MRAGRGQGFTLIELLVVLVIIGIITTFAVIAVRGRTPQDQAEEALRRIASLLDLASEQAVLEGREYGVRVSANGYRFLRYRDSNWRPVTDDRLLRRRTLEPGLEMDLWVEGQPVALGQGGQTAVRPQLLLYSSGERSPFELEITPRGESPRFRLQGNALDPAEITALQGVGE